MSAPPGPSFVSPSLISALPDLLLSACFFLAWVHPDLTTPAVLDWMVLTMLLEFIVVHSGGFMGTVAVGDGDPKKRTLAVLGLGLFYTLFVAAFSVAFKSGWLLGSFWLLTLNRASGILLGVAPSGEEKRLVMSTWAASTAAYIGGVALTCILPMPRLGFSNGVVAAMHLPGGGLWIEQPWRAIAFGGIYFGAVGMFEAFSNRMFRTPHVERFERPPACGAGPGG